MVKTQIDDKWIRQIHRDGATEYTFCGALEYRYNHIAKNWNTETRKKHDREYNNIILPAIDGHDDKSIHDYTKEDYEKVIETIREKGYEQEGVRRQYADSSIRNFENLIYYVVYHSAVYGLCDNVLWGTKFVLDVPDEEEEIESRVLLKKSLSVEQEKLFSCQTMSDVDEDGAIVALLLMWSLGLRNGEACGLDYGDIKPIEGHKGCYAAWIYKSTVIGSNKLQSGGKTYNTGRIVPVPQKIIEFLNNRKARIRSIVHKQQAEKINIKTLPICCDGWLDDDSESYMNRCSANRVSFAAHEIFESSGISPRQLAYLDMELSEGDTATVLKEKDPTAYLLRRNYATQMCILGLSNSQMQYLIGHDVEDAYESRNEYVDSERIYEMYRKLQQRPLLNDTCEEEYKTKILISDKGTEKMHIFAKEPTDCIRVDIDCTEKKVQTSWFEEAAPLSAERIINNLKSYHKRYDH